MAFDLVVLYLGGNLTRFVKIVFGAQQVMLATTCLAQVYRNATLAAPTPDRTRDRLRLLVIVGGLGDISLLQIYVADKHHRPPFILTIAHDARDIERLIEIVERASVLCLTTHYGAEPSQRDTLMGCQAENR